jgi:hypothetical protein
MATLKCIFSHKWVDLLLVVSNIKKLTRLERRCDRCGRREIQISQFNERTKREIDKHFVKRKEYQPYKKGDWLDTNTRFVIVSKIDEE